MLDSFHGRREWRGDRLPKYVHETSSFNACKEQISFSIFTKSNAILPILSRKYFGVASMTTKRSKPF